MTTLNLVHTRVTKYSYQSWVVP